MGRALTPFSLLKGSKKVGVEVALWILPPLKFIILLLTTPSPVESPVADSPYKHGRNTPLAYCYPLLR